MGYLEIGLIVVLAAAAFLVFVAILLVPPLLVGLAINRKVKQVEAVLERRLAAEREIRSRRPGDSRRSVSGYR